MSRPIHHFLQQSLTLVFYRQQAGLFLFLLFFLFGTQPSFHDMVQLHYHFMQSVLHSFSFYCITVGIWLVYTIKVILFIYSYAKKESYTLLFLLNELPLRQRILYFGNIILQLLAPIIVYGSIIIVVGISDSNIAGTLQILATLVLLLSSATIAVIALIRQANDLQQYNTLWQPTSLLPVGLFRFLLQFVFQRQFVAFFITKVLSFLCLYFFSRLSTDLFEGRMLWLIYLTALIGHSFILYNLFCFQEKELAFLRNMPIARYKLLPLYLLLYSILLLPEAWAIWGVVQAQHNWSNYIVLCLSGPSLLLLLHALLYTEDMRIEEFLKLLFGVWIVFIFFSLSENKWLIPLISFGAGSIIFLSSYYKYEKKAGVAGIE